MGENSPKMTYTTGDNSSEEEQFLVLVIHVEKGMELSWSPATMPIGFPGEKPISIMHLKYPAGHLHGALSIKGAGLDVKMDVLPLRKFAFIRYTNEQLIKLLSKTKRRTKSLEKLLLGNIGLETLVTEDAEDEAPVAEFPDQEKSTK